MICSQQMESIRLTNTIAGLSRKLPSENDNYNQDYKHVYDFQDDGSAPDNTAGNAINLPLACMNRNLTQQHLIDPDASEDFLTNVAQNEYNNGGLERSVRAVHGKRAEFDGYSSNSLSLPMRSDTQCIFDNNGDSFDVIGDDQPSPFFADDDNHDAFDAEQSFEDGDWDDEDNYIDDYLGDDCW